MMLKLLRSNLLSVELQRRKTKCMHFAVMPQIARGAAKYVTVLSEDRQDIMLRCVCKGKDTVYVDYACSFRHLPAVLECVSHR